LKITKKATDRSLKNCNKLTLGILDSFCQQLFDKFTGRAKELTPTLHPSNLENNVKMIYKIFNPFLATQVSPGSRIKKFLNALHSTKGG
jgi:hypothetical protein